MKKWYLMGFVVLFCLVSGCSGLLDWRDLLNQETDVPIDSDPGTVWGTVDFVEMDQGQNVSGPYFSIPLGVNHSLSLDQAAVNNFCFPVHEVFTITVTHSRENAPLGVMFVDTTEVQDPRCVLFYRIKRDTVVMPHLPETGDFFAGRIYAFYLDIAPPDQDDPVTITIAHESGYSNSMTVDPTMNVVSTSNLLKISRKNLPKELPENLFSSCLLDDRSLSGGNPPHAAGFILNKKDKPIYLTAANWGGMSTRVDESPYPEIWEIVWFVVYF